MRLSTSQTCALSTRFVFCLFWVFRFHHLKLFLPQLFIKPLREAYPPIIGLDRLERFILEVFGNYREILAIHERLLRRLCERQMNQHPEVSSVTDLIYDALLQWGDAYRVCSVAANLIRANNTDDSSICCRLGLRSKLPDRQVEG